MKIKKKIGNICSVGIVTILSEYMNSKNYGLWFCGCKSFQFKQKVERKEARVQAGITDTYVKFFGCYDKFSFRIAKKNYVDIWKKSFMHRIFATHVCKKLPRFGSFRPILRNWIFIHNITWSFLRSAFSYLCGCPLLIQFVFKNVKSNRQYHVVYQFSTNKIDTHMHTSLSPSIQKPF